MRDITPAYAMRVMQLRPWIDRIVGIGGQSPEAMELMEERIASLKPRLLWLYPLITLYLVGVALALHETGIQMWSAVPMGVVLVTRFTYWMRQRRRIFRGNDARRALRDVAFGALAVGLGYLYLLVSAAAQVDAMTWQMLLLSGAVCAIGR